MAAKDLTSVQGLSKKSITKRHSKKKKQRTSNKCKPEWPDRPKQRSGLQHGSPHGLRPARNELGPNEANRLFENRPGLNWSKAPEQNLRDVKRVVENVYLKRKNRQADSIKTAYNIHTRDTSLKGMRYGLVNAESSDDERKQGLEHYYYSSRLTDLQFKLCQSLIQGCGWRAPRL